MFELLLKNYHRNFFQQPNYITTMSISFGNNHSSAVYNVQSVPNDVDSSSDEEIITYTLEEAIQDWLYSKTRATQFSYTQYVRHFRNWLRENYNRDIDVRLKQKHVKMYLVHKGKTTKRMRPVISTLKSLIKHLKSIGFLKRDILLKFENVKSGIVKHERTMDVSTVKLMFKQALKKTSPRKFSYIAVTLLLWVKKNCLCKIIKDRYY
jgi:hypothetical protein